MRVKFDKGKQRDFLDNVINYVSSPSLRGLLQFGIETKYSTLKNYYSESRLIPEELFNELLEISGIKKEDLSFVLVDDNWGRSKGGKISKRKS